jgi:phage shock protein PspC (stress-responsive transcriptional regulator)
MSGNLFTRDDTLLGVCEGLGEEFGFHPNILRVVLAAMLIGHPPLVIAGYLVVGLVLMVSRWLFPARHPAVVAPPVPVPVAQEEAAETPLPLAA